MIDRIERTILHNALSTPATPVVLMVSGGSDSTALAYIADDLAQRGLTGEVAILHVNHKLRGEDAFADRDFVRGLADVLDIPLFDCEIDIPALIGATGGNVEAVARHERYLAAHEALESLCRHVGVPVSEGRIATAHTADDRVENFYMRSIVGTGPGGFRSMLYRNGPVIRPFLDISRQDLRDFIDARAKRGEDVMRDEGGNLWREDATNAHTDRFRAFVRHEIIPLAKTRNPALIDTLTRSMNLIADEDDMLDEMAREIMDASVEWLGMRDGEDAGDGCIISTDVAAVARPLQRRIVYAILQAFLGADARIENASIEAVLAAFDGGAPVSGYVTNIQGNLAVSANKNGIRIEHMAAFRARRKKD